MFSIFNYQAWVRGRAILRQLQPSHKHIDLCIASAEAHMSFSPTVVLLGVCLKYTHKYPFT